MNLNMNSLFRIIGLIITVIGVCMIPSFFVSMIYDGPGIYMTFLVISLICMAVGLVMLRIFKHNEVTLRIKDGFLIVTLCWILTALIASLPFMVTGAIPDPIDAFFEMCSGFSTTGATILTDIEALPKGLLFWRSFTHWLGGMGILVFAIAFMPSLGISGQNIAVSETPGPNLDKTNAHMSATAKSLYMIYTGFTIAETILLMLGGMDLYDALVHTFGSVATGGMSPYGDSVGHFDSTYLKMVITLFMFMCGVNFNLYYDVVKGGIKTFTQNSEFKLYVLIAAGSIVFIFSALLISGTYESAKGAFVDSSFQVVSLMTTTGYGTADYEIWPVACQMLLFSLMFIGGSSASTSGGLKTIRVLVILKLIRRGVQQRLHPNAVEPIKINGRALPSDTVTAITNHTFLYIGMVFVGAFIIAFENVDIMTCFSSVVTCLGNVGPGFGIIGPTENFAALGMLSKFLLSIYMIAGRLELYTLFILLTPRFWNQDH